MEGTPEYQTSCLDTCNNIILNIWNRVQKMKHFGLPLCKQSPIKCLRKYLYPPLHMHTHPLGGGGGAKVITLGGSSESLSTSNNLVLRGRDPFGQRRGSQPLARSNTGSPGFTDFPSLCACPESSLTNLNGSGLNLLCLQSHSKPECHWTWPGFSISSAWQKGPLGTRLHVKVFFLAITGFWCCASHYLLAERPVHLDLENLLPYCMRSTNMNYFI